MAEPWTSLRRLDRLSAQLGVALFAKRESEGATGTQKDRIAGGLVHAAVAAGAPGVTVGTCGNLGAALAFASRAAGHVLIATA
jgi:threonine synthase